jgi:hypothetical protein
MVAGGVTARQVMRQLALDIAEQAAGSDPEQGGREPIVAQLLFHERQPFEGLLSRADSARGLESDLVASALVILSNGACHGQADFERRVHGFRSRS